jgi:DNA-binding HxlR family transcriptional regulator
VSGTGQEPARAELSAVGQALEILGDRWVLLILQRAFLLRIRTFAGWRDALGISESVLASRLKELVGHGIFELSAYRNGRTRYEYRLTKRGLRLWALLVAIHTWERDWADRRQLQPLRHDLCGEDVKPYLGCGACLEPMSARDTRTEFGPSAIFSRIGSSRRRRRTVHSDAEHDLIGYCPDSMEILGDRWSTSILAAAFLGTSRFVDFQSGLGIAPSVLTDRLRRFVELGVFDPRPDGSYRLTDKGLAFFEVFAFLVDWAQGELPAREGSRLSIIHRPCGAAFDPVLLCTACVRPLRRREVRFILGGEGTAERAR